VWEGQIIHRIHLTTNLSELPCLEDFSLQLRVPSTGAMTVTSTTTAMYMSYETVPYNLCSFVYLCFSSSSAVRRDNAHKELTEATPVNETTRFYEFTDS
jgi:hypothetical protein